MTGLFYLDPHPSGARAFCSCMGWEPMAPPGPCSLLPLSRPDSALAPDASGFGKSRYDGRGWNFRRSAADLAVLLKELETGPTHIVGISMGGVIALQFAIDYPEVVKKLVLVNTFAVLRPAH